MTSFFPFILENIWSVRPVLRPKEAQLKHQDFPAKPKIKQAHTRMMLALNPARTGIAGTRSRPNQWPKSVRMWGSRSLAHYVNTLPSSYCMRDVNLAWTRGLMSVGCDLSEIPHCGTDINKQRKRTRQECRPKTVWGDEKVLVIIHNSKATT